ncbi:MAG: hypothetical protein A3F43_03665 [Gammaproteobacteria bacterium RIFCSPHIGHO2_12_FULL_42_10]|nr:MAG: hypothetical protein A3F43_03665 [Gammaproteobacteria bacterium RIFCSPHIGHO2_12_FULL_42_10]
MHQDIENALLGIEGAGKEAKGKLKELGTALALLIQEPIDRNRDAFISSLSSVLINPSSDTQINQQVLNICKQHIDSTLDTQYKHRAALTLVKEQVQQVEQEQQAQIGQRRK